ncbi:phage minor tail protein L [Escherichia coli]|nr:phage minor tail protein L [Escherichia coli]
MAATQERLNRNIAARSAAQNALNSTTAVGSRLMSGALGLVGGVPGLVMLGAAAWYTLYQNQEQARESARQYALTIDEIAHKTPSMSLPEASDNEGRTRAALTEQNRLIDEQASRVKSLQEKIAGYQYVLANPGWTTGDGFMINHLTSVKTVNARFLDAVNFVAGNPEADPEQELSDRWVVEQMSELTAMTASFVLATPTETDGALFPGRIMLANTCMWTYRSDECGYTGGAVADEFDKPTTDIRKDRCSKCMRGCEMRGMVANFGGFLSINKLSQ